MERYGEAFGTMGENLSFGKSKADEYMISLYIDDGVLDRGHRSAITNPKYNYVGVAYCPHNSSFEGMVALAYATDFILNELGKAEIERRFTSRREGSNVNHLTAPPELSYGPFITPTFNPEIMRNFIDTKFDPEKETISPNLDLENKRPKISP